MDILKIIQPLIYTLVFCFVVYFAFNLFFDGKVKTKDKARYIYRKKDFLMSLHENQFYQILIETMGNDYYIFAQVHLSSIVDHKIPNGQGWKGALSHIQRKSVDFLLCDKEYISPKLVIELDGRSHDRPDRAERDVIVDGILRDAGVPFLRVEDRHENFDKEFIKNSIKEKISQSSK